MPELPEVETVARDLRGAVLGRRIRHVTVDRPDVVKIPDGRMLPALLEGQRFEAVERHGKYLLLGLDSGDDLMVHLGMTGHLLVCDADAPAAKHTHIRALLDDGQGTPFRRRAALRQGCLWLACGTRRSASAAQARR